MNFSLVRENLSAQTSQAELHDAIVNLPFGNVLHATSLGLGIVVLLLINKESGTLDRIALSRTELAEGAVRMSSKPFHEIKIPLDCHENLLVTAIETQQPQQTDDWANMFIPELTAKEARFNQAGAGIDCSVIYPLSKSGSTPFGAMIFSFYQPIDKIGDEQHEFMQEYSELVANTLNV